MGAAALPGRVRQRGSDGLDQPGVRVRGDHRDPGQATGGQVPEEAFHHIEPRGTRRREMQMKARMLRQPFLDLGMFVGCVVIQDQMQVPVRRRFRVNELQEFQPLLVAVPVLALADQGAVRDVEGGEERGRAVAHIVVSHRPGTAFFQR